MIGLFWRISGADAVYRLGARHLVESYITSIDHWIAFVLLVFIGGKMIAEAVRPEDENVEIDKLDPPLDLKEMLVLAVATSIDALAVGITFAF